MGIDVAVVDVANVVVAAGTFADVAATSVVDAIVAAAADVPAVVVDVLFVADDDATTLSWRC